MTGWRARHAARAGHEWPPSSIYSAILATAPSLVAHLEDGMHEVDEEAPAVLALELDVVPDALRCHGSQPHRLPTLLT